MELPNNVVVYSFGGRYQVTRQPGQPDLHTVYVKGLKGDLVAQMTRNDAVLITSLDFKQPVLASNLPSLRVPLLEKEGSFGCRENPYINCEQMQKDIAPNAFNHPQPLLVKEWRLAVKRVKATFAYFVNKALKQNPCQIRLECIRKSGDFLALKRG